VKAKQEQKIYVEKLQEDMNTLSDNSIGCSGVINTDYNLDKVFELLDKDDENVTQASSGVINIQEMNLPLQGSGVWNPNNSWNTTILPEKEDEIFIHTVQPQKIEKPSKTMESYPERAQRKVQVD